MFASTEPHLLPLPGSYEEELSTWQWLLLIKVLRVEKLVFATKSFVRRSLGDVFAEAPGGFCSFSSFFVWHRHRHSDTAALFFPLFPFLSVPLSLYHRL